METLRVERTSLGDRIRKLREELGLTQSELAERAILSVSSIGDAERGKKNLTISSTFRIAEALKIDICSLLRGTEWDSTVPEMKLLDADQTFFEDKWRRYHAISLSLPREKQRQILTIVESSIDLAREDLSSISPDERDDP